MEEGDDTVSVAPFAGAWIETNEIGKSNEHVMSHPSRVRGLKPPWSYKFFNNSSVAPFAGAWIETRLDISLFQLRLVAPFAGAWIETIEDS